MGPSLGAINRSILLSCDYFVTPMSSDIFSILAIENIGKTINSPRTVELENEIKKRIGTKSNAFLSIYNFLGFFCYYLAFALSKDKTKNKSYNRTSKEYLP